MDRVRTSETPVEPLLLRVDAATARLVGLKSAKRLYTWISTGVIPPAAVLRVGSAIFLRRQVLVEWASANGATSKTKR